MLLELELVFLELWLMFLALELAFLELLVELHLFLLGLFLG